MAGLFFLPSVYLVKSGGIRIIYLFSVVQEDKGHLLSMEITFKPNCSHSQPAPSHWYKYFWKSSSFYSCSGYFAGDMIILWFCLFFSLFFKNVKVDKCLLYTLENPNQLWRGKKSYVTSSADSLSCQLKILIVKHILYYKNTKILSISVVRS